MILMQIQRNAYESLELLRWGKDRNPEKKHLSIRDERPYGRLPAIIIYAPSQRIPKSPDVPYAPAPGYSGYDRSVFVSVSYKKYHLPPSESEKNRIRTNTKDSIEYIFRFEDHTGFSSSENSISKEKALESFSDDAVFKLIISPEDSEILTKEYVRSVMDEIENRIGRSLKWTAIVHDNTDHPHVHIIISRTDGEGLSWETPLRLDRNLISKDIREYSQGLATRILGKKTQDEIRSEIIESVRRRGLGRLDHRIYGNPRRGKGLFRVIDNTYSVLDQDRLSRLPKWMQKAVLERLEYIAAVYPETGIFLDPVSGRWKCTDPYGWKTTIMEKEKLSRYQDISAEYGRAIRIIPSDKPLENEIRGKILRTDIVDDNAPKAGVLLLGEDGELYYVEGDVPYQNLNSKGEEIIVFPRDARTERYRTPQLSFPGKRRGGR